MHDRTLKELLDKLNMGRTQDSIHLRELTPTVFQARAWITSGKEKGDAIYSLFFVRDEQGRFVSLVLDMGNDLHWYTMPAFRGKKLLSTAMRTVILPFLFEQRDHEAIRITITSAATEQEASTNLARALGFVQDSDEQEGVFILESDGSLPDVSFRGVDVEIPKQRRDVIHTKIKEVHTDLKRLHAELSMAKGVHKANVAVQEAIDATLTAKNRIYDLIEP